VRSRGTGEWPGAERDLVEAGLNEPADAAARYGFCGAAQRRAEPARSSPERVGGWACGKSEALIWWVAPGSDIPGWAVRRALGSADCPAWRRPWGIVALIGGDTETPPWLIFAGKSVVMMYRARDGIVRSASEATPQ
jgi:hypothetical protein